MWLNFADPLSIVPWGAYFPSSITGAITSGPLGAMGPQTAASAQIFAQVDVQNARAAPADMTLAITVMDADGATVATSSTKQKLPAGGWARLTPSIPLSSTVNLWNTESTYMYAVRADVLDNGVGGAVVDSVTVPIGVRDAIWTPNQGFMLNGFKVPAKGFSQHQDFAGTGTAVPDRVNEFRVQGIRAIGGNFWRTAHNPTNPELLDFADKHGMLMWVENRFINKGVQPIQSAKDAPQAFPPFNTAADPGLLADAQAMVLRDRNHPSVVIWSLCNEGGCQIGSTVGASIGAQFKNVITYADTTRPITANGEWSIGTSDTMTNVMDVRASDPLALALASARKRGAQTSAMYYPGRGLLIICAQFSHPSYPFHTTINCRSSHAATTMENTPNFISRILSSPSWAASPPAAPRTVATTYPPTSQRAI